MEATLCASIPNATRPGMDGMKENLSYDELIAPVRERMMRVIWRVIRHPEEAEDTMQEVLTIIWKKRGRIARHPNPQALILKICMNKAVDALRKRRRGDRFAGSEVIDNIPDAAVCRRDQDEMEGLVRKEVGRLPRKQAVAVVMRILEERSYREIAVVLGCREATARTHVLRARNKLARHLSYLRPSGQEEVSR